MQEPVQFIRVINKGVRFRVSGKIDYVQVLDRLDSPVVIEYFNERNIRAKIPYGFPRHTLF